MKNNDNFYEQKNDMVNLRVAPCCGELRMFNTKELVNSLYCNSCYRAFTSTGVKEKVFFTLKDEVKIKSVLKSIE